MPGASEMRWRADTVELVWHGIRPIGLEEKVRRDLSDAGYTIVEEGNGGSYDKYDAEDAPGVYGFKPNGMGGISITVEAD